jgi:excisionase family DNA binding protein
MSQRTISTTSGQANPRFYSVAEVAQIFGTSRMTMYRAVREGQLPAVRVRGRLFVPARALDAMVDAALAGRGGVAPALPEAVAQ